MANQQDTKESSEPPLELILETGGKRLDVELNKPFEIAVDHTTLTARLLAKSYRVFDHAGVRFRYPRAYAFEFERDGKELEFTTWTLSGNTNRIMLHRFLKYSDHQSFRRKLINSLVQMYQKDNVRLIDTSIALGGQQLKGTRLDIMLVGVRLWQDVFSFSSNEAALVLVIQDSPGDDGHQSQETQEAMQLLAESFRFPGTPSP
jgi:hypothetical protein